MNAHETSFSDLRLNSDFTERFDPLRKLVGTYDPRRQFVESRSEEITVNPHVPAAKQVALSGLELLAAELYGLDQRMPCEWVGDGPNDISPERLAEIRQLVNEDDLAISGLVHRKVDALAAEGLCIMKLEDSGETHPWADSVDNPFWRATIAALVLAANAHQRHKRMSGGEFVMHEVRAATLLDISDRSLRPWSYDLQTNASGLLEKRFDRSYPYAEVITALLHDVTEEAMPKDGVSSYRDYELRNPGRLLVTPSTARVVIANELKGHNLEAQVAESVSLGLRALTRPQYPHPELMPHGEKVDAYIKYAKSALYAEDQGIAAQKIADLVDNCRIDRKPSGTGDYGPEYVGKEVLYNQIITEKLSRLAMDEDNSYWAEMMRTICNIKPFDFGVGLLLDSPFGQLYTKGNLEKLRLLPNSNQLAIAS